MSVQKYSFAKTSLSVGTTPIPSTALGAGVSSLQLKLTRRTSADATIWPSAAVTVTLDLQVSYDGGVTWVEAGKVTAAGGLLTMGATEIAFTIISFRFAANPTHVKGSIIVAGGSLVTAGSLLVN